MACTHTMQCKAAATDSVQAPAHSCGLHRRADAVLGCGLHHHALHATPILSDTQKQTAAKPHTPMHCLNTAGQKTAPPTHELLPCLAAVHLHACATPNCACLAPSHSSLLVVANDDRVAAHIASPTIVAQHRLEATPQRTGANNRTAQGSKAGSSSSSLPARSCWRLRHVQLHSFLMSKLPAQHHTSCWQLGSHAVRQHQCSSPAVTPQGLYTRCADAAYARQKHELPGAHHSLRLGPGSSRPIKRQ